MTRLILRELARWVRTVGAPLIVVAAVVVTPSLLPSAVAILLRLVPERAASITWMAAVAGALAWLATAGVRAALQPARDTRASERLQELRDRSVIAPHALVFVTGVLWTSPAGQRIAAVDTRTGEVLELWLAEGSVGPGAFALLGVVADALRVIDRVEAREVAAAQRHTQVIEAHRRSRRDQAATLAPRLARRAASEVVRAAEELLQ